VISSYTELRFRRIETYRHNVQESVLESANNLQNENFGTDAESDFTVSSS
jgi:hypothetical protein